MPTPSPTATDIANVRVVAGIATRAEATTLIDALDDAEWELVLEFIEKWKDEGLDFDAGRLTGILEDDPSDARRVIRRAVRNLFGLSVFTEEDAEGRLGGPSSVPTQVFF